VRQTGNQSYSITYHLDDNYNSSFLTNASAAHLNAKYIHPTTDSLYAEAL